ncbi:MAG: anti-sigma factor, partial [Myxococcales bacterium]
VAAACAAVYLHGQLGRQRTQPFIAAAVAHHQRELPLEVTEAQLPAIQTWFKGKVDFAPTRIPALSNVSLLGARLSNITDRQAAYVAWGAPGGRGRVSLFVFDAPELEVRSDHRVKDREVLIANQQGYNVAMWKDNEIAYSLVSDLSEEDILRLVSASDR